LKIDKDRYDITVFGAEPYDAGLVLIQRGLLSECIAVGRVALS
jgi:hypothetical protein